MLSNNKRLYLILCLPAGIIISYVCSFYPPIIERYYSTGVNRVFIKFLSTITSILPFSRAEAMLICFILVIYCPYTGEANVNMTVPDAMLPCTVSHEMAHQRGFAREDEANYIAYFTCNLNPNIDFQYSGNLLAVINSMNMLKKHDLPRYSELQKTYNNGVQKDLEDYSIYIREHESLAGAISNDVNDLYLKSNRQSDGVYSYNRMVDLLIAEFRTK